MGVVGFSRAGAFAEFPGVGELSMTRAIVLYRDAQAADGGTTGVDDVGVALVTDGEYAAASEALDLGSGRIRQLDLATEAIILDWVYASTLDYVRMLIRATSGHPVEGEEGFGRSLRQYCQDILLGVLGRIGFDPLTRPAFLRLGFRDIVRDFDPNDRAVIRIGSGEGDGIEVELDAENHALLVSHRRVAPGTDLERVLQSTFPSGRVRKLPFRAQVRYRIAFPVSCGFGELRALLDEVRIGLLALLSSVEPERYVAARHAIEVFGPRDTLAQLDPRGGARSSSAYLAAAGVA